MYTAPIPDNDSDRLATLHRYAILDTPPERGYDDATTLASYICATPFSTVTLVDRERQWFKSEVGFGAKETRRAESFCACALLEPETLIIEDTWLDPRFAENPFVLGGPKIRFYAGAPLVAPNGHILGTVCVFDTKPRTLSPEQLGALESLSRQVMSLLEARLRLLETQRAAAALMQTEKLAVLGRLAASVAHEINNPLEAVTNLLYLSRLNSEDPHVQTWLDQADMELRRIAAVTGHTLRFHRQSTQREDVSCLSLFSATLDLYGARLNNSAITVEKRKRAHEQINCFEGDVRQALSNLFTNAIDAMPNGGRLLLRSRDATDWRTGRKGVVLTVADSGTGMSAEAKRRLFEVFFTTKGNGGSGLGLWISKEIVTRHQGRILVRSSQQAGHAGTVVSVFLPFVAA